MEPELPTGMQTFEDLRTRKTIYVDKTDYFPLLTKGRKVVFCARPRRFGKSLTG
ncbi:MAG: AAA family ATPase [Deltaproteobacteria bacterium]|nr:AAA family ATPase [Deltaproteobacteria bacterium]